MKKPLFIFAAGISLVGCVVLATCSYHAWFFGNGNINQVTYITKIDPATKAVDRTWADLPTAERDGSNLVSMWLVGAVLLLIGPAVVALESTSRENHHF